MIVRHLYHLVDNSPWPFFLSIGLFFFATSFGMFLHFYSFSGKLVIICFFFIILVLFFWWRDVIRESTYLGLHTRVVQQGLRVGFLLFIVSEVFFFFAFFWAFFHNSLCPSIWVGGFWPPLGLKVFSVMGVPFLNTMILLTSGVAVTLVHWTLVIREEDWNEKRYGREDFFIGYFNHTIVLGLLFILMQFREYLHASFSISDGIYGSVFYLLTGLHGFHVIVGLLFLLVCYVRFFFYHFTSSHHLGFEFAIWYWHFVDVVWLFLFLFVYCWGNWSVL